MELSIFIPNRSLVTRQTYQLTEDQVSITEVRALVEWLKYHIKNLLSKIMELFGSIPVKDINRLSPKSI